MVAVAAWQWLGGGGVGGGSVVAAWGGSVINTDVGICRGGSVVAVGAVAAQYQGGRRTPSWGLSLGREGCP